MPGEQSPSAGVTAIQAAFPDQRIIDRRKAGRRAGDRAAGKTPRPRAVIPVDLFGLPADYDAIAAVAARHGLTVIEDAAQSFGGVYKGKKTCAFGDDRLHLLLPRETARLLRRRGDVLHERRPDRPDPPLDSGPRPGERQVRERPDRDQRTPGHPAGRDPPGQVHHLPGGDRSPPGGRENDTASSWPAPSQPPSSPRAT